jgi:hypothetical protein
MLSAALVASMTATTRAVFALERQQYSDKIPELRRPREEKEYRKQLARDLTVEQRKTGVLKRQNDALLDVLTDQMPHVPKAEQAMMKSRLQRHDDHALGAYDAAMDAPPQKRRRVEVNLAPATYEDFRAEGASIIARDSAQTKEAAARKITSVYLVRDKVFRETLQKWLLARFGIVTTRKPERHLPRKNTKKNKSRDPKNTYAPMQKYKKRLAKEHREWMQNYRAVHRLNKSLVAFITHTQGCQKELVMAFLNRTTFKDLKAFNKESQLKNKTATEIDALLVPT